MTSVFPIRSEEVAKAFGALTFQDPELEKEFRRSYMRQSSGDAIRMSRVSAWLFALSAPFDLHYIGNGGLNQSVLLCWLVRAAMILILFLIPVIAQRSSKRFRPPLLIGGWLGAVLAFWLILTQVPAEELPDYLFFLALASLIYTSFLPLTFLNVLAMQLVLVPPFALSAGFSMASSAEVAPVDFALPAFVVAAAMFLGLNSKRSYEKVLRENFLRNLSLIEARDAAERADRAKSEFLATVSHELRTPLNAMLGNIRLLEQAPGLPAETAGALGDAERAGRTMTRLVEDVLEITSTDVQGAPPKTQAFRLGDLISDLEATLEVLAEEKSIRLELPHGPITAQWLEADAHRLRQILLNLLGNAIKFTRQGHVRLRLRIGPGRLYFRIVDSGVGMPEDQVARAFETFFRGSNVSTGEFRGTGLGLAIVDGMIRALGGSVALRSRLGEGTTVFGWIPATCADAPAHTAEAGHLRRQAVGALRILMVEDEPVNMAILRRWLDMDGHHVFAAMTGAEAIAMFQRDQVHCVLTDIRLPDMDGVALVEELTRLAGSAPSGHVPVYAVTANVLAEDLARYEAAGFDGVIPKPIDFLRLDEALCDVARLHGIAAPAQGGDTPYPHALSWLAENEALARLYRSSASDCAASLDAAIETGDMERLRYVAHRMRGAAASYGDTQTAEHAAKLEQALSNGGGADPVVVRGLRCMLQQIVG